MVMSMRPLSYSHTYFSAHLCSQASLYRDLVTFGGAVADGTNAPLWANRAVQGELILVGVAR